ncbi:hypothetical protein ACF1HJ_09620 [Streptomyces sp. NPDC013978]|uniref:hypothetical protein n=1 Tax=Streptomyces sp. NPDC013978 TaxID=3364869 RepID=UPI0036F5B074
MSDAPALVSACAQLVMVKAQLDDWLVEGAARGEQRSLSGDGYSAWRRWRESQPWPYVSPGDFHGSPWREGVPEPRHFLTKVFPWADFRAVRFGSAPTEQGGCPQVEVDSSLVVGGLWHRPYEHDLRGDPPTVLGKINESGGAQYARVGALPLYAAIEGKNRVSLAQRLRLPLVAEVAVAAFPEAGRLRLHRARALDAVAVAVSHVDSGELHFLPLPEEATAVLAAYGVPWDNRVIGTRGGHQEALDTARKCLLGRTLRR